jgi:23S rRNA pseudouridine2605 synthase
VTPGRRPDPAPPAGPSPSRPLSLARALSKFGVCSRKQAALRIAQGGVLVNEKVETDPARRIDPRSDRVTIDGRLVGDLTECLVLALHKPLGYITSRTDPGGRPTVYHLIGDVGRWVFPVGRLDRDTSGLLILTNDHRLGQQLTDPEVHLPKAYHARVKGLPDAAALCALREGLDIGDGLPTRPAAVSVLGTPAPRPPGAAASTWLEIVLTEGRNRQVRRMCAAVGHQVLDLVRVRIGGLGLGDLAPGAWRRLTTREMRALAQRVAA